MTKKTVHYSPVESHIVVGQSAFVYPIDHPNSELVSNTELAITTTVLNYDSSTGVFETRNTIYVPG